MLRLNNIKKTYITGDLKVEALKGINLSFRASEFVAILGPSGCGKTTLLNIIGGLDKYTSGDLLVAGKSTKEFKERDWDVYRNHRIGFVFQSYNLIPHQTILENVELALTIAGISKEERQKRAKEALDKVGLKGLYKKKPGQLSGGQCQRVAIARSLVNEPEILLADEPTGALDTETSIQIMDLMKEVAKDKLVIMVTHNPELADKYATRIVRLLDGNVIEDTKPFSEEDEIKEVEVINSNKVVTKKEKAKMSWWTSFKLSAKNLLSKSKRTILTCIAGSIGIVGTSAVLAVSSGVSDYIVSMQDDMLSGNPITIEETTLDLTSLMNNMSTGDKLDILENYANVESLLEYVAKNLVGEDASIISNDINEAYVNYLKAMPREYYNTIAYNYGINIANNIYTDFNFDNDGTKTATPSLTTILNMYKSLLEAQAEYQQFASLIMSLTSSMSQVLPDEDYVMSQYDLKYGKFPTAENELLLVLSQDESITDLTLAQLGYYTQEEFLSLAMSINPSDELLRISYDEITKKEFYYYPNDSIFKDNTTDNPLVDFEEPFTYTSYADDISNTTPMTLKVVGIVTPKDDLAYGCLSSGFYYTEALTNKIINDAKESRIVEYANEQMALTNSDDFYFGVNYNGKLYYKIGFSYYYYDYNIENKVDITIDSGLPAGNTSNSMFQAFMGNVSTSGPSLRELGGYDLPNSIQIYPLSFEEKDLVTNYLDAWNADGNLTYTNVDGEVITLTKDERANEITYSDPMELIITIINGMIDIVTIALICFTALSLVVSCVMIAIITYVSVMERVKEIGVIRALGGRKKDVSNLFNAETMIIGAASGLFGIIVTYILSIIVNVIVDSLVNIYPIANLPWWQALIMLLVSIVLTAISGFIPARSAAKKDPAVALRTE